MTRADRRRYLLLVLLTLVIVAFHHAHKELTRPRLEKMLFYDSGRDLGVRDPKVSCQFPLPHPFDPSILRYIAPAQPIRCSERQLPLTMIDDEGMLGFNVSALLEGGYDESGSGLSCTYQEISRPPKDDFTYLLSPPLLLVSRVRPNSDFVRVDCHSGLYTFYTNFHAFAQRNPKVRKFKNEEELGVVVVGLDSMSRLNFLRQLPATYRLVRGPLSGHVMFGFNKVGENTFPNVIPMLTGHSALWHTHNHFQDWPLIWKEFEGAGASTLYAEDQPKINMFDYLAEGLSDQPTTHYMRTFWLAAEDSHLYKMSSVFCLGPTPKHIIFYNYIKSFLSTYRDSPVFLFSLFNEPMHDIVNTAGAIDNDLVEFLNSSYHEGLFNRSVLFVLADHGNRIDKIRQTRIGQIEDRMPMVSVVLPDWMERAYPEWSEGLTHNSQRLLSSYDLHATWRQVLATLGGGPATNLSSVTPHPHFVGPGPGQSMFRGVSRSRTCHQAGVPSELCVCDSPGESVPSDGDTAVAAAHAVVTHLNALLQGLVECAQHRLSRVEEARARRVSSGWLRVSLVLWTKPGDALFEATVLLPPDSTPLVNNVFRINKYGSQASCLPKEIIEKSKILQGVCYCII